MEADSLTTISMNRIFKDRKHAGQILGKELYRRFNLNQPVIVGIPRGGVEVAYYVAQHFNTSVTAIISRKLPYPGNKEVAFGAIAEDLSVFVKPGNQLDPIKVMMIIEDQMDELERRLNLFRSEKILPEMQDKTVLLVDDGIATGATIVPVLQLIRKKNPLKIIVAAPVSGPRAVPELYSLADEVVILEKPDKFNSVSQFYENFKELNDNQVKHLLQ